MSVECAQKNSPGWEVTTRELSAADMRTTPNITHPCQNLQDYRYHPHLSTHLMQAEKATRLEAVPGLGCGCGLRQLPARMPREEVGKTFLLNPAGLQDLFKLHLSHWQGHLCKMSVCMIYSVSRSISLFWGESSALHVSHLVGLSASQRHVPLSTKSAICFACVGCTDIVP